MASGDVDGSCGNGNAVVPITGKQAFIPEYSEGSNVQTAKFAFDPNAVPTFSVPADLNVRAGDTVSIPLNIRLNGKTIESFDVSVLIDSTSLLSYTGQYSLGNAIPKSWGTSVNYPKISSAKFGSSAPVTDGVLAVFKFVVNPDAKPGAAVLVLLPVVQAFVNYAPLTEAAINGKFTVSAVATTAVEKNNVKITEYSLSQNYPNPFNPTTSIEYALPKESKVVVEIFNSVGQRVAELFNGVQSNGSYKLDWNAGSIASGVYFYSIKAASVTDGSDFKQIRKMILMK